MLTLNLVTCPPCQVAVSEYILLAWKHRGSAGVHVAGSQDATQSIVGAKAEAIDQDEAEFFRKQVDKS